MENTTVISLIGDWSLQQWNHFFLPLRSGKLAVFIIVISTAILSSFNSIAGGNCDWEELFIYNGIRDKPRFVLNLLQRTASGSRA